MNHSDMIVGEEILIEPERYELAEAPAYRFELDRRDFFRVLGAGLVVVALIDREPEAIAQQRGGRRGGGGRPIPKEIGAWIHIGEDGGVSAFTGKAEVGQDIRTSLAQAVADELRVPMASVSLVMADTRLVPYDMGTFGSRTTPGMAPQLRKAAAAARERLIDLAAERWKVDRSTLSAADGQIRRGDSKETIGYGPLTKGKRIAETVDDVEIGPPKDWTVAGRSESRVDGRAFVTGRHKYASDVKLDGMLRGKILRPPSYGATLTSIDAHAAEAMPGVAVIRDGDFVGVVAPTAERAEQALKALKAEWKQADNHVSGKNLFAHLRGGVDGNRQVATYTVAYIAHAPLETRAAVAQWEGGKLTVWTGTQRPFGVRGELASAFRVREEDVRVIVPDTGAGYGGKHTGEAALEAARLAKGSGRPVKLVWTREEEFTWAYFRPAGVIEVTSAADKDGTITAWEFHNYNSGGSGIRPPYAIANPKVQFHQARSPLRQGSYRALAATANHFARESEIDELAHAIGMDPLAFRLKNLQDARMIAVLKAAADRFGWGAKLPDGRGAGIACGSEKGGYVAACAEVAVDKPSGKVRVVRAVVAFECGAIVNPDGLKNQVEGATIQGLGGALFEAIAFEGGKITNAKFSRYRLPRFRDVPKLEVVLIDRKDIPSAGAGETPIVGIAPAIGNAIFHATGRRLRSLPMVPDGLKA
jgi:isoquinoline 1-oxidoreductase